MTDDRNHSSIARSFSELTDSDIADIENVFSFGKGFTSQKLGWSELLCSKSILLVSEASTGKTHECRGQRDSLQKLGEAAFFLELATLAGGSLREQLDDEEEQRFEAWLASPSDLATFFLDSIDELKLTLGRFDQALKRLAKELKGQLGRARIVITTRPIAVDQKLIEQHLPYPEPRQAEATAEAFADMVVDRPKGNSLKAPETKTPFENAISGCVGAARMATWTRCGPRNSVRGSWRLSEADVIRPT